MQANSVVIREVPAEAWLHRFIIGKKGANIKNLTADVPKVSVGVDCDIITYPIIAYHFYDKIIQL